MSRVSDLTAETAVDVDDVLHIVDVSDTTDNAGGSSMKTTVGELLNGMIRFFQVEDDGTTGQLTTGTAADLAGMWGTPSLNTGDFSWNGTTGILTADADGVIEFDVVVTGWNNANNRSETHVQIYKNGSTVITESAQYSTRNNTQDEGGVVIAGFKDSASATDTYRLRVFDVGSAVTIGASAVSGMTWFSAKLYKS